ncbi:MAG: putative HNHc nuclease [Ruminococcus sp.]|nr:putative HNHc nuclease [Ruminococcus sp.]
MVTTAKIIDFDGKVLTLAPDKDIMRELKQKDIKSVEIRLNDGRTISAEQRRKIFAIIRDISSQWSGHTPEEIRILLTWDFLSKYGGEWFSLSDVDMTTAKEFITYLIDFCFYHNVPTKDTLLNQTDDIGKYLYMCLEHRKCAICNMPADVHHVDRIGMGSDREKIVHVGLNAIALCRKHHDMAHMDEKGLFEQYFVYGIKLDKYLCERLRLRTEKR